MNQLLHSNKREPTEAEKQQLKDAQMNIYNCIKRMLDAGYSKDVLVDAISDMFMNPERFFK